MRNEGLLVVVLPSVSQQQLYHLLCPQHHVEEALSEPPCSPPQRITHDSQTNLNLQVNLYIPCSTDCGF